MLSNMGHILFNRSQKNVVDGLDAARDPLIIQTQQLLEASSEYSSQNQSAWERLGLVLTIQDQEKAALNIWHNAEEANLLLRDWGEHARRLKQYDAAFHWYEQMAYLTPNTGDALYYIGLTHQDQQQWGEALQAYDQALQFQQFDEVYKSDIYLQQGLVYQQAQGFQDLDSALQMYDTAIHLDTFSTNVKKALVFYKRGEIYGWQERDLTESISEYEQALLLNPNHLWARLRLGSALYWAYGDVSLAEKEIEQAIAQWPKSNVYRKWPYRYLGEIYVDAGLPDKAIVAYKEALQIAPNDQEIQTALETLYRSKE